MNISPFLYGSLLSKIEIEVGKTFIQLGYKNQNNSVFVENIEKILINKNINIKNWKNMSFINGDDSSGYWINEEKFNQIVTKYYAFPKKLLIFIIICVFIACFSVLLGILINH